MRRYKRKKKCGSHGGALKIGGSHVEGAEVYAYSVEANREVSKMGKRKVIGL